MPLESIAGLCSAQKGMRTIASGLASQGGLVRPRRRNGQFRRRRDRSSLQNESGRQEDKAKGSHSVCQELLVFGNGTGQKLNTRPVHKDLSVHRLGVSRERRVMGEHLATKAWDRDDSRRRATV